jgi:hypothetical protein
MNPIHLPPILEQILVGLIIVAALGGVIRLRFKVSKSRQGSCSKCNIEH